MPCISEYYIEISLVVWSIATNVQSHAHLVIYTIAHTPTHIQTHTHTLLNEAITTPCNSYLMHTEDKRFNVNAFPPILWRCIGVVIGHTLHYKYLYKQTLLCPLQAISFFTPLENLTPI